jgi:hypothetical protein
VDDAIKERLEAAAIEKEKLVREEMRLNLMLRWSKGSMLRWRGGWRFWECIHDDLEKRS